jgi:excinuclease ABC subunit C
VVGLGEKRKKELLRRFESVDAIRLANPEEITELKGFNRVLAERILLQLNEVESEVDSDIEEVSAT